ncbi:MAG: hypothetical protein LBC85_11160 [Fibromonadaceae bacterium]|jgi:hypothetical protein|nr:hypothetical protein [Fibromonadaceae bacterium]
MKLLVTIPVILFFGLFILIIPVKIQQEKFTDLLKREEILKDSVRVMQYNLALVTKEIDSLSSRGRIEEFVKPLGLEVREPATKITRYTR